MYIKSTYDGLHVITGTTENVSFCFTQSEIWHSPITSDPQSLILQWIHASLSPKSVPIFLFCPPISPDAVSSRSVQENPRRWWGDPSQPPDSGKYKKSQPSQVASKHKTVLTKNPRKCTFHVFTLWIHTANCLLFSILCYIEELSRYTVPATTTTTTAAMMLPVLCLVLLCRLIRLAAGVDYRTIVTRPLFSPVWLSVHSFWNLFQLS